MGKAQSKLNVDILHDLQNSTYCTRNPLQNILSYMYTFTRATLLVDKREILQWYQGFVKEAPQGYFTKSDFNRMFCQFFPFGEPLAFAQIMFNMYDTNQNGVLEFKEFMQSLSIATRGKFEEKLQCRAA
jgi:Ca2+-binding EF-hand superfamily protein